jgi:ferrous iron transport protein B
MMATLTKVRRIAASGHRHESLVRLGLKPDRWDYLVALAGNPNVGKTTVFNALTGLRQHTGNWPGKTVARAEGAFAHNGKRVKVVDLPGTYSLQAGSTDEEIARDFIVFGRPDVTVVVVDATRLERNLNLVLQILEITDRVVVCLNLVDEARRHGIAVDPARLERALGVPVIPTVARRGDGIDALLDVVARVAAGERRTVPYRLDQHAPEVERGVGELVPAIQRAYPGVANARWVALRLLNGDEAVAEAVRDGDLGLLTEGDTGRAAADPAAIDAVLETASRLRWGLGSDFHDAVMERLYAAAAEIAAAAQVQGLKRAGAALDRKLDELVTSRWLGFPIMLAMLAAVFWITIEGSNVPSHLLAVVLVETLHPWLVGAGTALGLPWWLNGFLFDGVYLATAWVVSVMLPPMAIFFPLFTLLEDFGYLPRVAFNMDALFRRAGAHGKQALTMCMGFGCNAAGVVSTRVIDSPRERLIAIITNNFSLCNGRWPTQILIATIFIGALAPAHLAGLVSAAAVVGIALLGVAFMFLASWGLSHTVLRGEATTFSLELPPYRPPRILQTLYTSIIDRTLIVLGRAVMFAVPAGAVIWLISNVDLAGASLAEHMMTLLDPVGLLIGLNGVILLAYVVAIPANEIVIPTILMLTVVAAGLTDVGAGTGVMFELDSASAMGEILVAGGWTLLTGVCLMLFSLLHNPCSTTLYTIYRETGSARWTAVSALLPLAMGVGVCFAVAQAWRLLA